MPTFVTYAVFSATAKESTVKAAFIEGDLVQAKPGIVHDQYPDIPLGGWVGNITRIAWLTPVGYEIHWTEPTLQQAHPVYYKRCQRDGFKPEPDWLETDQLDEASLNRLLRWSSPRTSSPARFQ